MKPIKVLLILFVVMFNGCTENEVMIDSNEPLTHTNEPTKWWVLTHPSGNNPGIHLYDEATGTTDLSFDLPADIKSPHALAFDGESLWLGGMGENEFLYELSPIDGSVRSKIPNIRTEGLAIVGDEIYYSEHSEVFRMTKNGIKLNNFTVNTTVINDIAVHQGSVYVAINGETDPIYLLDQQKNQLKELLDTKVTALYTLAVYDNYFVFVGDASQLVRVDIGNKQEISRTTIKMPFSWVTAITPNNVDK